MNADGKSTAPPGAPPKTPLELWREIAQLHLHIGTALRELDELMTEWLAAQDLDNERPRGAS